MNGLALQSLQRAEEEEDEENHTEGRMDGGLSRVTLMSPIRESWTHPERTWGDQRLPEQTDDHISAVQGIVVGRRCEDH